MEKKGSENKAQGKRSKGERKGKKKRIVIRILLAILLLILLSILSGIAYAAYVIHKAPGIDPDKLYSLLSESTVIYDDKGKEVETVYSDTNRDNITIKDMPKNLQNAFIALEDKTFRKHHGFNYVRMVGAIRDSVFKGGRVSGTSTITQQLARNVYLRNTQYDYSIKRKIIEAYYTHVLEKNLSKDKILESYLNTISFGFHTNGVEAASEAYFSKSAKDLTLEQCAALAALPQAPSRYQLVQFIPGANAKEYKDVLLKETNEGIFVLNDISKSRRDLCLDLMEEQGYITKKQRDEAKKVKLKDMLNPNYNLGESKSAYFVDYVIDQVADDLVKEKGWSEQEAREAIYAGGLRIYTTMDSQAQAAVYDGFHNPRNFPAPAPLKDRSGNILNKDGRISLFLMGNLMDKNNNYILPAENFKKEKNGDLTIYKDGYLNIYKTQSNGVKDYNLELKKMYTVEDGDIYSVNGGIVNIPAKYKKADKDGNIVISKKFVNSADGKKFFIFDKDGTLMLTPDSYTLRPKIIQPQGAMTIIENKTGEIKAMQGGRGVSGRMTYNRAIGSRQPGSSIKPIAVYGPAIQQSFEEVSKGVKHKFKNLGVDKQGSKYYGEYLTAASIVVDEPIKMEGRIWPYNFSRTFSGPTTMRNGMAQSLNTVAVKVMLQMGLDYSWNLLPKFGLTSLDDRDKNYAALCLGGMTHGVSTLEMASAFSTFPNGGKRVEPKAYTKVESKDGKVILKKTTKTVNVLDPGVAFIMNSMLQSVVKDGEAGGAAIPGTVVGGKTGTTDNSYDIWFDGVTPNYTASLWIGNDDNFDLSMWSRAAADMWGRIMRNVNRAYGGSYPSKPSNVIISAGEYFINGTEKGIGKIDDMFVKVKICKESGMLATPWCKDVEEKTFNKLDPNDQPPKYYCPIHNEDIDKYPIEPDMVEAWLKAHPDYKKKDGEEGKKDGDDKKPDPNKPEPNKP